MSWIFFAIAAPALYSVCTFMDKFVIDKHLKNPFSFAAIGGGVALIFALTIPFWYHWPTLGWGSALLVLLAGAISEFAAILYFRAMELDDASRVAPMFSVIPLMVLIFSYIFLREALALGQLWGFGLVLVGGFLLSLRELSWKIFQVRRSAIYILFASLCWATSVIIFKFVVEQGFWDTLFYELVGSELAIFIFFLFPTIRRQIWTDMKSVDARVWGILTLDEGVYLVGRLSGFYAFSLAAAPLVSVMGGFQPFFALAYGLILSLWFPRILKEDIRKETLALKFVSILLIFGGLWLVNG